MKTIVQINQTCGSNSIGRTTLELAEYLNISGYNSIVVYASGTTTYQNSYKIGSAIDHKLHALFSRITGMQGYFSIFATLNLIRKLSKVHPDIIHIRNLHGNYINLPLLFKYIKKNNIALVVTLHDCWIYTGKCTYYTAANCNKWKNSCGNCPLLKIDNVNPTWFFDKTSKCINDKKHFFENLSKVAVVGVSNWVTQEAKYSFLAKFNPVCIYNWIDTTVFHPMNFEAVTAKYFIDSSKFKILMITAQVSEIKGYNVLLQLCKCLDFNKYAIILVGSNPRNLPIPSNVKYINHTDDTKELAALYSCSDVCVNTTKYETFGKVTAESICCGTPVIVYNNTASPELVGEKCGFIINESDGILSIIDAIETVYMNGKDYYSSSCVSFANQKFCKEKCVAQYLSIYNKLI